MASLLRALEGRGLLAQVSDRTGLDAHLAGGSRVVYAGVDPTASSLQVGNLVTLLMLRRFQLAGHRPIAVVGGATGLIGDPSGRIDERALNDVATVEAWVDAMRAQVSRFVDLEGNNAALVINNLDWTRGQDVIGFLRDVGKHFSVNAMMQRDSVRSRLDRDGAGISYTEFSYMLLQAFDFLELARRYGCTVQVGGSDQWGNIVSGVDLVRRVLQRQAYAFTHPLITKQDGTKFGKSADGAIWLDAGRTSPYAFYQFWLNAADADAVPYLRCFTLLEESEIEAAAEAVLERPELRDAQRTLAREVTRLVHGAEAVDAAERITTALFDGQVRALRKDDLSQLARDGMAVSTVAPGTGLLDAMTGAGLAPSNGAARRLVQSRGVRVNGDVVVDAGMRLEAADALHGRYHVVRRGRKNWHMVIVEG
ncbi:MAG: tyrosine--tRNA ligase [Gammaproteobacteria bacterium]|nr:tyrosine--tRNA ligase [Gammaproteobacteria bacterium]